MSDDADPELLALLRQALGMNGPPPRDLTNTRVLASAEFIYDNSTDVALDMRSTQRAAAVLWTQMQSRDYTSKSWAAHELHPTAKDASTLDFVFTMDLLNFCFWSEKGEGEGEGEGFAVEWKGKRWTGYWSLVAALWRALEEGIPITSHAFWHVEEDCPDEKIAYVFRSATKEEMPLLKERIKCMREAAQVLCEEFEGDLVNLINRADKSAAALVNILADHFPCFRDEARFEGRNVRFLKRAQIFVADLWAAFEGEGWGEFHDIDRITMFADYRIPQMLYNLGCLSYSPPLESIVRRRIEIEPGSSREVQLRGCSIWCVEQIRREIVRHHPEATVNAVLIDFLLYDIAKELEASDSLDIPHHRTRSIWY
ncbi:hypothetical protein P152DRAFT_393407 [Eremomyces bilateralis CBS 781.70]|uniref:Queuosine 5'-phosphate N-glycosylase/hydrolase n=1 Tax=Eremomyces bilateralis CBS 781.70 TaxID=1392243 RepID=A0A6G1G8J9_9PEZI|nr:uncharacterized protein P152DRAFT_393407 [Eremomyces bilateralis CBS 781.70]KAF1814353.1 hypothetical protein P152DRAFT_393407 [Eremomyces bilateralis CBS 781.70]